MDELRAQRARGLLREGRSAEALAECKALTQEGPGRGEFWYLRSMAEQQLHLAADARSSVERALAIEPGQPYFRLHSGRLAQDAGDLPLAIEEFRRATQAKADWPLALANLGAALFEAGRAEEAVDPLSRAVTLDPRVASVWNNLGLAHAVLDHGDEARRAFESAAAADPRNALAHLNLARLHQNRGDNDRALACATKAAALDSSLADAHLLAGDLHRGHREEAKALASYRAAMAAAPANPAGGNAVGELLWEMGVVEEARQEYGASSRRHPGSLKAALGARLLLPQVYEGNDQLEQYRRLYREGLEELLADPVRFSKGRPAEVLRDIRWCNFYLAYQGRDDREFQSLYGDLIHRVLEPVVPQWLASRPKRVRGDSRIRVGFLSHFFFDCTAGRYFSSWIRFLDPKRFETVVYYTNPHVSADTREIEAAAARFRHLPGRPVIAVAKQVLADDLDVLVYPELGMHPDTFALASLRLAPVQCAGWGHPTTTGLPTIDWFLSSEAMEPEEAQAHYRERLALLPGLGTRYEKPSGEEQGTRADFGLPERKHLYLVPQSVFKIHPDNDELIADVLAGDPEGVAVMFAAGPTGPIDAFVRRLKPVFASRGLATDRHLVFLPYMTHAAYLGVNRVCDVMLDTLHWSGGNTSLDALAMGLPVVTLPGRLMRGRQSLGMLRLMGQEALVARDATDYSRLAVRIASDRDRREAISGALRENADRLFGQDAPIEALAAFLDRVARG